MVKETVSSLPKDIIYNHKRIIVIAVAIVAISMYMAPFDKLLGINTANAQPGKNCTSPGFSHGLKYGIEKHAKCVKDAVKTATGGIKDTIRKTIGGTSDSPTQAAHTNTAKPSDSGKTTAKPSDSGKTTANDVKTKVKDKVQGNGGDTHTAKASSNVKPSDSSKPSDKPNKGKLSDSIKSRIRGN